MIRVTGFVSQLFFQFVCRQAVSGILGPEKPDFQRVQVFDCLRYVHAFLPRVQYSNFSGNGKVQLCGYRFVVSAAGFRIRGSENRIRHGFPDMDQEFRIHHKAAAVCE